MTTDSKQSAQQTGADIVVKTLEQNDVKWVFGIPGAKIDKVFNTLVDSSIQTVVCRHEQQQRIQRATLLWRWEELWPFPNGSNRFTRPWTR
jgi:Thiamine pyrophosphate enzyme, N-terminal TPP binding domain